MLKRDYDKVKFNNLNPWIASVLDSNMNLQVVMDVYACVTYVVEYVNKANRGTFNLHKELKAVVGESTGGNLTYTPALEQLSVEMLKAVKVSAQKAAWYFLGLGISHTKLRLCHCPSWREERVRVRKTRTVVERDGHDKSSTDVLYKRSLGK